MAIGVIGAIADVITNGPEGMQYAAMSIAGVDPIDNTIMLEERTFQYWPTTISDSLTVGWNFKEIPGMSNALAQWSSNGGRTISFEVHLHRFMKPVEDRNAFELALDPLKANTPNSAAPKDNRSYNVDVAAEIRYLRSFCYPSYKEDKASGYVVSYPPPVALLCVPGHALNGIGDDVIYAVMTACDITYLLSFPNGVPRRATVSLTFRQVIQDPFNNTISSVGFDKNWLKSDEDISFGGNRTKNKLNERE